MQALTTLFPVFFMLALGFVARAKQWITPEQKNGANSLIFNILFPILIFNLMCQTTVEFTHLKIVGYVLVAYLLAMGLGKLVGPMISKEHASIIPYLFPCCEGGNVALPLYLSIVGQSTNTVIFDLAGTLVAFVIIPVLVAKSAAAKTSTKQIIQSIFTNSFVLAVIFGLVLNFTGLYNTLMNSSFGAVYTGVINNCTAPIVPMILFILGYDLQIDKDTLAPILKFVGVKTLFYAIVIVGFFFLVPELMADKTYMMAPIIYFMSPTGFAMPALISPLLKTDSDKSFTSAAISIYMIITLIVYTALVLFVA